MNAQDILAWTDPVELFAQWYALIQTHPLITEPTAVTLATASRLGEPSVRTVLLKEFSRTNGFVFYTNYESRKGMDLSENPNAALLFYWGPLFRQVIISGKADKISRQDSEAYWRSRPRESQLAGWVSQQSRPVSPQNLDDLYAQAEKQWQGKEIPCPSYWGGFAIQPETMEFWVGQKYRLHDRIRFKRTDNTWQAEQLFP